MTEPLIDDKTTKLLTQVEEIEEHLRHCPCLPFVKQKELADVANRALLVLSREALPPIQNQQRP